MLKLKFDANLETPIYKQITRSLKEEIDFGDLKGRSRLPSVTALSESNEISFVTISRAYRQLKKEGYISYTEGKGYFVCKRDNCLKILMVLNKLSSYKKYIYYSFKHALEKEAQVDLKIHHYDPSVFKSIINESLGKYDYYVIMPHFFNGADEEEYLQTFRLIPHDKLLLLDKDLPQLDDEIMAVYQDFEKDIFNALNGAEDLLQKYKKGVLIFPGWSNHPSEVILGAKSYCKENGKTFRIAHEAEMELIKKGTFFIVTKEADLAELLKLIKISNLKLGEDIGVISFNETVLKELLDITVITTDWEQMGATAGNLILNKNFKRIKNPFKLIKRGSL
ncbi:GntR family transcriptional regulator [Pedobacter frigiditerrae]|uniref:GntR family transcriptional regulator n=1 Tax=Pedobacter frigiditerrae TaxID=2530452 RepID=A0A4R0MP84_9SPHI|nr:GntR family transcriptional regulator [Pedobacter frigiditerrae]TCC88625.1 GntR family transcriptional regulator [Pedobacter frigiditerrae]